MLFNFLVCVLCIPVNWSGKFDVVFFLDRIGIQLLKYNPHCVRRWYNLYFKLAYFIAAKFAIRVPIKIDLFERCFCSDASRSACRHGRARSVITITNSCQVSTRKKFAARKQTSTTEVCTKNNWEWKAWVFFVVHCYSLCYPEIQLITQRSFG